jgi:hypothetical protein
MIFQNSSINPLFTRQENQITVPPTPNDGFLIVGGFEISIDDF